MKPKKKIKAIIFDLGGVVVHGGYLDFVKHFCSPMTPAGKRKIAALEREANLGMLTETQFYQELQKAFDIHLTTQDMHKLIVDKMKTDQGLVHLIPKLEKSKISLFSNSIGDMAIDVLHKRHLNSHRLFKRVFISSRLHLIKPDQVAYRYVLKKLKVAPREALMVDDRAFNIRGARRVGMEGIVYKNSTQFRKAIRKYEFV